MNACSSIPIVGSVLILKSLRAKSCMSAESKKILTWQSRYSLRVVIRFRFVPIPLAFLKVSFLDLCQCFKMCGNGLQEGLVPPFASARRL